MQSKDPKLLKFPEAKRSITVEEAIERLAEHMVTLKDNQVFLYQCMRLLWGWCLINTLSMAAILLWWRWAQ